MLLGFSVGNYRSFNETQSISFLASKITRHKEHVANVAGKRVLRGGLIFGANASGKSNVMKAVSFSKNIILNGLENVNLNKRYFRIVDDNFKIPGTFDYRIVVDDKEYSYGIAISYENKEIMGEWLYRILHDGRELCIFDRFFDGYKSSVETEVVFQDDNEKIRMQIYLDDFKNRMSDSLKKKTILSDIANRNTETTGVFAEINSIFDWFRRLLILFPGSKYKKLSEAALDEGRKNFFTKAMRYFDTGIESVESEIRKMDFDSVFSEISPEQAKEMKIDIINALEKRPVIFNAGERVYRLEKDENDNIISTKLVQNHGNVKDLFEYMDESDGTKRLFDFIPLFYNEDKNNVILIDEIDRSLHTNLTKQFLELFYAITNEKTQLIATTHDSNLLDLDLLRQDEIWFVERQGDHSSSIYSLNKFKERFDKKVNKDYLLGRYGAIPVFNENFKLEQIDEE